MPLTAQRQGVTVVEARLRRDREERHSALGNEGAGGFEHDAKEEHAEKDEAPRAPLGVHGNRNAQPSM